MTLILGGLSLLAACSEEAPPRSVAYFLDQPIMLEAAIVRCLRNRKATRYDAECVNARMAAHRIEWKKDEARKAELEALSKRKRLALRRTQAAVKKARERAAENEDLRIQEEYLAQFEAVPPRDGETRTDLESVRQELQRRNAEGAD